MRTRTRPYGVCANMARTQWRKRHARFSRKNAMEGGRERRRERGGAEWVAGEGREGKGEGREGKGEGGRGRGRGKESRDRDGDTGTRGRDRQETTGRVETWRSQPVANVQRIPSRLLSRLPSCLSAAGSGLPSELPSELRACESASESASESERERERFRPGADV